MIAEWPSWKIIQIFPSTFEILLRILFSKHCEKWFSSLGSELTKAPAVLAWFLCGGRVLNPVVLVGMKLVNQSEAGKISGTEANYPKNENALDISRLVCSTVMDQHRCCRGAP